MSRSTSAGGAGVRAHATAARARATAVRVRAASILAACALSAALLGTHPAPAAAQSLRAAAVLPRGFYPAAGLARLEVAVPGVALSNVFVAGEIYGASHENVTQLALSGYVMLRHEPFPRWLVSPYAAAGFGAHAIRTRVSIPDVRVLTVTETTAKGQFWAGVRLPGVMGLRPWVETRWTIPSDYVFDYVAGGIIFF